MTAFRDPVHPRACGEHRMSRASRWMRSVHPRACGEHRRFDRLLNSVPVHPRACGNTLRCPRRHGVDRFIPALAGNTIGPWTRRSTVPVHPRACGEHDAAEVVSGKMTGSSPRLRGTRRISPSARPITVHPRACGEHSLSAGIARCRRFIPAHAGNTPHLEVRRARGRFIPALAGNTSTRLRHIRCRGSSPRMRGSGCFEVNNAGGPVHPRAVRGTPETKAL